jgi:hypothetical protein
MDNSPQRLYDNEEFERDMAQIEAELALVLLARFIAARARLIVTERERSAPDAALLVVWQSQLQEAAGHHRTLDTRNLALVRDVDRRLRALFK